MLVFFFNSTVQFRVVGFYIHKYFYTYIYIYFVLVLCVPLSLAKPYDHNMCIDHVLRVVTKVEIVNH